MADEIYLACCVMPDCTTPMCFELTFDECRKLMKEVLKKAKLGPSARIEIAAWEAGRPYDFMQLPPPVAVFDGKGRLLKGKR
jgi:hypothetical protein